ncbi:ricin-type beta-trefoil lectin domain protein [Actinacidiphila yeochonensis]|uniref:ricin-type beta-trefoil lectin domain protein n=1 Tax=Actinacidiphila yeochonensis TaxID=89050 RepID=UPI00099D0501|nr:ricin-type beta-trefoil lectin domain protein [Actinacidiphila yeochonensis]
MPDRLTSTGTARRGRRALGRALLALAAAAAVTLLAGSAFAGTAAASDAAGGGSGLDYVAMGSSYAAGPGIPPAQTSSGAATCKRSDNNYASIVAREIGADLTDASCYGATTANVLTDAQSGQPPQVQAVTSATDAVTVTIGGNDVDYLGSIDTYSCLTGGGSNCGSVDQAAINQAFGQLAGRLENVVNAVHSASPLAHVYLVDYFTILPDSGVCANVPLTDSQAAFERSIATRLAAATATAASTAGATLVDLASASHGHDACAATPWVETYRPAAGRTPYHPNEAGMRAAASLVEAALLTSGQQSTVVAHSGVAGKCLDVAGANTANGTPVQIYGCNGSGAQRWTYTPTDGGTLRALGGCLDVSNSGTADKTKVQLWQCNGSGAQRWTVGAGNLLINPESGRCLDDPAGSSTDATQLQIYDCNGSAAQRWTLSAS